MGTLTEEEHFLLKQAFGATWEERGLPPNPIKLIGKTFVFHGKGYSPTFVAGTVTNIYYSLTEGLILQTSLTELTTATHPQSYYRVHGFVWNSQSGQWQLIMDSRRPNAVLEGTLAFYDPS
ncbi:hypothetical protein HY479_02265 [Candidatus Uhrbacteria bacterium]|nr:hypothetical protein [Candidatus Uhrbacteria bacterium]